MFNENEKLTEQSPSQPTVDLLVIPDIHHNHTRAQSIIDRVRAKKVVLLGDYFDAYGAKANEAEATAAWLKEKVLYNPSIVPLIGNHDVSYIWNKNPCYLCSGYSNDNSAKINAVLNEQDKKQFKVFHAEDGYLFSHAGLSNILWERTIVRTTAIDESISDKFELVTDTLGRIAVEAIELSAAGHYHWLFGCGADRGGQQSCGGITWVDWRSFAPLKGVNQIVGHTRGRVPRVLAQRSQGGYANVDIFQHYSHQPKDPLSISYCLDTGLDHYATITNGVVEVYDYITELNLRDYEKYAIPANPLNNFPL